MRCARCNRPLSRPAVLVGRYAWGPRCAKLAGLAQPKGRKAAAEVVRDPLTADLFEGWDLRDGWDG